MITSHIRALTSRLFRRNRRAVKAGVDAIRLKYYRERFKYEAALGSSLFGATPEGTVREFFCLNAHTWIWHEQWTAANGSRQRVTTRYAVRPDGVYKYQHSAEPQLLQAEEAAHFYASATAYCQRLQAVQATQQLRTA